MDQSMSVREVTVQEIQLERIRRTRFNAMDGQQVYDSLLKHPSLWLAVLLDRPGVSLRLPPLPLDTARRTDEHRPVPQYNGTLPAGAWPPAGVAAGLGVSDLAGRGATIAAASLPSTARQQRKPTYGNRRSNSMP
jgi:hypothetical protein